LSPVNGYSYRDAAYGRVPQHVIYDSGAADCGHYSRHSGEAAEMCDDDVETGASPN
jgi:hypothetical protein